MRVIPLDDYVVRTTVVAVCVPVRWTRAVRGQ